MAYVYLCDLVPSAGVVSSLLSLCCIDSCDLVAGCRMEDCVRNFCLMTSRDIAHLVALGLSSTDVVTVKSSDSKLSYLVHVKTVVLCDCRVSWPYRHALERQDLPCTHLGHHELESIEASTQTQPRQANDMVHLCIATESQHTSAVRSRASQHAPLHATRQSKEMSRTKQLQETVTSFLHWLSKSCIWA